MKLFQADQPKIRRGDQEHFTGAVWIEDVITIPKEGGIKVYRVFFEPEARTVWHAHPEGQVLHVVTGVARVQARGESTVEVRPGETVYFEPGEKHWHGAAPRSFMVHYAVSPVTSDQETEWLERVTKEDYQLGSD